MSIPNILTLTRVALAWPMFAAVVFTNGWAAICIYVAGLMTDFLDGKIARATDSTSAFGGAMDSVSDKVLVTAAMMGLVHIDALAPAICFAFLFRELLMLGVRAIKTENNATVGAINDRLGRIRFFVLHAGVAMLVLPAPALALIGVVAVLASLAIAYAVFAYHVYTSRQLLQASMSSKDARA